MSRIMSTQLGRRILWIIVAVTLVAVAYFAVVRTAASVVTTPKEKEIVLKALPLHKQNLSSTVKYIGYVTPIHQVSLQPNVSGYVSKVWVKGGEDVKAGDKLLMIDQRQYQAAYDAAVAAQSEAAANFNNAKVYFDRIKKAGRAISKTEYDNAQAKFLSAQAAVAAAKADAAKAKVMLDYTLLTASIDGTIGNIPFSIGTYVAPNSGELLSIVQYDPIYVVFSISDKEYLDFLSATNNLLFGQKIKIRLANGKIYNEEGVFRFTQNRMDNAANSIAVYVDFKNPRKELVANAYVDVLLERQYPDSFQISQNYVDLTAEGVFANIVKDSHLSKTKLDVLATSGNSYIVGNKFGANEYLVTDKVPENIGSAKVRIDVQKTLEKK